MSNAAAYRIRSTIPCTGASWGAGFFRDAPLSNEGGMDFDFHLKTGDYFGTLATVIALVTDALTSGMNETSRASCVKMLSAIRSDLASLQKTHRIVKK